MTRSAHPHRPWAPSPVANTCSPPFAEGLCLLGLGTQQGPRLSPAIPDPAGNSADAPRPPWPPARHAHCQTCWDPASLSGPVSVVHAHPVGGPGSCAPGGVGGGRHVQVGSPSPEKLEPTPPGNTPQKHLPLSWAWTLQEERPRGQYCFINGRGSGMQLSRQPGPTWSSPQWAALHLLSPPRTHWAPLPAAHANPKEAQGLSRAGEFSQPNVRQDA